MTAPAAPPPAELPAAVGHLAEIASLVQDHHERLVEIVRRRIDPQLAARIDAEGVVNEAFVAAGRRWLSFKADRRVSDFVWLYRIVCDTFVEHWRKATAGLRDVYREERWDGPGSVGVCGRLVAAGPGPATEAERNERAVKLGEALAALTPDERAVIRMRSEDGLRFSEIAENLGTSEAAAAKRYVRALHRLKSEYTARTGESRP